MALNIDKEIARLEAMTVAELQAEYAKLWACRAYSRNKVHLIRRCAWKLQELEYGGLSEEALRRAEEIAEDAMVRMLPPRDERWQTVGHQTVTPPKRDPRLPKAGSTLVRHYKGITITVEVGESSFLWNGEEYKSLSAVAKAITGSHVNGYSWFGLTKKPR